MIKVQCPHCGYKTQATFIVTPEQQPDLSLVRCNECMNTFEVFNSGSRSGISLQKYTEGLAYLKKMQAKPFWHPQRIRLFWWNVRGALGGGL